MRFIIIASPRTGSSHLVNTLGGHPQVVCNGNIYKTSGARKIAIYLPGIILSYEEQKKFIKLRQNDPEGFLDKIYATDCGRPCVGFKIFEGQNEQVLAKLIDNRDVRKVVLYRENVLANYSSALIAMAVDKWGVKEGAEVPLSPKVNFDEQEFLQFQNGYIAYYRRIIKGLNSSRQQYHLMQYTDINDSLMIGSLLSFIGADPDIPIVESQQRKRQVKLNPSYIFSRFSNQNVVEAFCAARGLSHWMHEGETSLNMLLSEISDQSTTDSIHSA